MDSFTNKLNPATPTLTADLPEHWDRVRLKHWVSINANVLPEDTEPGYKFNYIEIAGVSNGSLVDAPKCIAFRDAPSRARRVVSQGDTIVSTVRTYLKAVWHAQTAENLVCSTGFAVLSPKPGTTPKFAAYLAQSEPFVKLLNAQSVGTSYPAIPETKLSTVEVPVPPPDEQANIVRYLDHADELINRYISAKERLIALLEEQRQAVIHKAVTAGLDATARLNPSNVEWLGDIPTTWTTVRIQALAEDNPKSFTDGDWIESPYITSQGIRLIQTGNIGVGEYREKGFRYISPQTFDELNCTEIAPNDILICRLGDPVARACLAPDLGKRMITSVDVCILKPHDRINSEFAVFAMNCFQYLNWVGSLVRGSTRDRISRSMLSKFEVPFPPLHEQNQIVAYLNAMTTSIKSGISNALEQIRLAQEYRTRLIADVVTGQIDVRNAAPKLPE